MKEMNRMKRLLTVILAAALILQTGAFAVYGVSAEDEKQTITISNIDTSKLAGGPAASSAGTSTEIDTEGLDASGLKIVSEEWTDIAEYVISGSNITIKDGKYSYRLVIRSDRTLTFDNDLEIYYQGVNGRYRLHYDIDKTDNHTMIVTGVFDNIIIASPLLEKLSAAEREWILTHISKDSYFYQLILKTKEGFSFVNSLRFLIDARKHGYIAKYSYDLLTDTQTLIICGIPDCGSAGTEPDDAAADTVPEVTGEDGQPDVKVPEETGRQTADRTADQTADSNTADAAAASGAADAPKAKASGKAGKRTVTVRYSKLRKKAQTIKASKIFGSAGKAGGRYTYAKVSGNKRITINKKTGRVTLKKGLKKGRYKVTVKMTPAGKKGRNGSAARRISFTVNVI